MRWWNTLVSTLAPSPSDAWFLGLASSRVWTYGFMLALAGVTSGGPIAGVAASSTFGVTQGDFARALFFLAGGLVALVTSLLAGRALSHQTGLNRRAYSFGPLVAAVGVVGCSLLLAAVFTRAPLVLLTACVCCGAMLALLRMAWGRLYGSLGARRAGLCTALSFCVAVPIVALLQLTPYYVSLIVLMALPCPSAWLLARAEGVVASGARVQPSCGCAPLNTATLKMTLSLAAGMFAFVLACELMNSMVDPDGMDLRERAWSSIAISATVALIALALYARARSFDPLPAYCVALPLAVAGYAAVVLFPALPAWLAPALVSVGYGIFDVLSWVVMVKLTDETRANSVLVFSVGVAATLLGRFVGAYAGPAFVAGGGMRDGSPAAPALAVILLLVTVCAVTLPRVLSTSTSPSDQPSPVSPSLLHDEACAAIAARCGLTERESHVMRLLSLGMTAEAVARELGVAKATVQTHCKHVYAKMGVHSQAELAAAVVREMGE